MQSKRGSAVKDWFYTCNNYTDDDVERIKSAFEEGEIHGYICGKEVGKNGTPHLHGLIQFNSRKRLCQVKAILGPRPNLQARAGTVDEAIKYVSKDGDTFQHGEITKSGHRSDLQEAAQAIESGATPRDINKSNPALFIRHHKGLKRLHEEVINEKQRTWKPLSLCFVGETELGKTRLAEQFKPAYIWNPSQEKWFDNYQGEDVLIMEEFRGQLPLGMLLKILDHGNPSAQTKGGMVKISSSTIILTSPTHPTSWYKQENVSDKIQQLIRRLDYIEVFTTQTWTAIINGTFNRPWLTQTIRDNCIANAMRACDPLAIASAKWIKIKHTTEEEDVEIE